MFNIMMISLGCDKNTVDSEEMLGLLRSRGYGLTDDPEEADAAIVNTCCFIQSATEESIQNILDTAGLKQGKMKYLVAAGCMAERYKEQMFEEFPEIDAMVGTTGFVAIADVLDRLRSGETKVTNFESIDKLTEVDTDRVITAHPYMEYLKIAEGCDKRCTYCAIPYFRGKYRSVPMSTLVSKAKKLADDGVKELILVAQETTCYGIDLYKKKSLHTLLHRLSEIEGIQWIRLLYCYPEEIYPELIEEIAENKKVLHYIDMPLQHTEDNILRRMGRRMNKEILYDIVEKLRHRIPDIAIRTTLITGFPGETEEQHESLMETINELEFDRLGVFTYSPEEGTPAAKFEGQIDEEVKARYRDEIMELQQEISYDKNQLMLGKHLDVMVEGYIPDEDVYVTRSYKDAPDVDGFVFVRCEHELMSGSIIPVVITGADEYDLTADIVEED